MLISSTAREPSRRFSRHASVALLVVLLASAARAQEPLFSFVQISDSQPQTAQDNQNFIDVLRVIAEAGQPGKLLPRPAQFVLFAGDITWGDTASEWIAAKDKLDTWLTTNGIPYRAVPGNHDVNNSDTSLYELYIAPSDPWDMGSAVFAGQNGLTRTLNWQGLRFIGFNNSNPGWNTIPAADVADISARVTAAAAAHENVFLLCHHPHDEKNRVPLASVLPNPAIIGYLRGHIDTAHVTHGLAGINNPNVWDVNTNFLYSDRVLVFFDVFPTQLRAYVVFIDNPLPAPTTMPLLYPLTRVSEPDIGVEGLVHANARPDPTGEAPEHKLWTNAGSWWAILWSDASAAYRIQRLQVGTQTWVDTGTTVSSSAGRSFDALASGNTLWVASNVTTVPSQAGNGSPGQLSRFTYDTGQQKYLLDAGFPVAINDARSETLAIARDSLGTLWATWTEGGVLLVNHTLNGNDATWSTPTPVPGAGALTAQETSGVAAIAGKIGVLWGQSADGTVRLALHADGDSASVWTIETATSDASLVGDQIDLASYQGRTLVAVVSGLGALNLLERSAAVPGAGVWSAHAVAASSAALHDPTLVVDQGFGLLRLFATGPSLAGQSQQGGGAIYEKDSPLAAIAFPPGIGTPVIQDGTNLSTGFASTTRSAVDFSSDLVVLASNSQTLRYWHAFDGLSVAPVPPDANFSANPLAGPAPLVVAFNDLSTGGATDWLWDFGDGESSTAAQPTHVYAQVGTYAVTLRVANGAGQDTFTRSAYVLVSPPPLTTTFTPVADARVNQASANTNYGSDPVLRLRLDSSGTYQSFLKFDLSSLQGSVSSAKLRLFCTDGSPLGGSLYSLANSSWTENGITWNNRPALPASPVAVLAGVTANLWTEIDVTGAVTGPGIVSLALAGGSSNSAYYSSRETANRPELVIQFAGSGTPPTADFVGSPLSGIVPLAVTFTDLSTGGATGWSWDFGDGATSTLRNPTHTYTVPGAYIVLLEVSNAAGLGSLQRLDYITALPSAPQATFTGTPLSGTAPLSVSFTDGSTNSPTGWSWTFGDGTGSTEQNPVHVYDQAGTYDVTLQASNAGGSNSFTRLAYVQVGSVPPPPVAAFTGSPLSGAAPLQVTFSDGSTGSPTGWSWTFGDGTGSSQQNPSHTYSQPGTYDVTLQVSNAGGSNSFTRLGYVQVAPPSQPTTVTRTALADAPVNEASATKNLGTNVELRVKSQAGSSYRSYLRFDLTGLPGTALSARLRLFVTDPSNNGGSLYAASGSWVENTITWANQPGLGTVLDAAPTGAVMNGTWIEFDVPGSALTGATANFAVGGGSTNSALYSSREGANPPQLVIDVGSPVPPVADFSAAPVSGSAPLSVSFTDLSTGATGWSWTFGDGGSSTSQNPTHVYTSAGTYSVTLQVTNPVGNSTKTRTDLVSVSAPSPVQTLLSVADSRVNESSPSSNYGTDVSMRVRFAAGGSYETYVRFDLSSFTSPIVSAKLRLFVTDPSDVGGRVFATSGAWTETGIKWSNKPAPIGGLVASAGTVGTNVWVEFDVTSAVVAGGPVNFVLQSTSSNSCYYSTREGPNPPQLVITSAP